MLWVAAHGGVYFVVAKDFGDPGGCVGHALVVPLQSSFQRIDPAHPVAAGVGSAEADSHTAWVIDCNLNVAAVVKEELAACLNAGSDLIPANRLQQELVATSFRHVKADVVVDLSACLAADSVEIFELGVSVVRSSAAEQNFEIAVAVFSCLDCAGVVLLNSERVFGTDFGERTRNCRWSGASLGVNVVVGVAGFDCVGQACDADADCAADAELQCLGGILSDKRTTG